MEEFDQREYQTVILAALLHDVGKLIHRRTPGYEGKHYEASHDFIKDNFNSKSELYDVELLKFLVLNHHSSNDTIEKSLDLAGKSNEKERILALVKIVQDADSYSCIEREIDDQNKRDNDKRRAPLDSIFSFVNLEPDKVKVKDIKKYHLTKLYPLKSFPTDEGQLSDKEIVDIVDQLNKNFPDFSSLGNFEEVINAWLNLLEQYTWAVPSDTRYEIADISLFDHLKTSAAVAACLYRCHIGEIKEDKKRWQRQYEFIFVGGDFSGIQNYIFNIADSGTGGISKRLRARSLFITLFSEITIHRILHDFNIPFLCNLFSAGGKFLLILPNLDDTITKLEKVKKAIDEDIHKKYFSQFSFLLSWLDTKYFKKDFQIRNFFKIADIMFHKLETEKLMKSNSLLKRGHDDDASWNSSAFRADDMYKSYKGNADCGICGKGPALFKDSDEEDKKVCCKCYIDRNVIGEKLPKTKYIAFGKGVLDGIDDTNKIPVLRTSKALNDGGKEFYYMELLQKYKRHDEYYMLYKIENEDDKGSGMVLNRFIANHVPKDIDGNIKEFGNIADVSIRKDGDKKIGSSLLGVLKADVDNLGLIFSKGFENPALYEQGLKDIDRKTVSRFLTLSRMLELFFSGWMKEIMSSDNKDMIIETLMECKEIDQDRFKEYLKGEYVDFKNIYTVYSGGDDLVLVGPWETMIVFAIFLNQQFREYTCNNKSITISAGLAFVKPKHPIASAIKQADELLERSKKAGKNGITLFGTTVEWNQLPELIDFFLSMNYFLTLNRGSKGHGSGINTAFLYRLLEYHRMASRFIEKDNIEGLKFMSALSYDIGRNIVERDKNEKIIKGQNEYNTLQTLINKKPDTNSIIYNLKIPLFWTLYRNKRGGDK